jgi:hypothetical protein
MDAHVAARQVANPPPRAVVEAPVGSPTKTAQRFFERRISVMTRALGSPKIPQRRAWERKPGNRYASSRLFGLVEVDIEKSCQIPAPLQIPQSQSWCGFQPYTASKNTHTLTRRSIVSKSADIESKLAHPLLSLLSITEFATNDLLSDVKQGEFQMPVAGISRNGVMIRLSEGPGERVWFGQGLAQRADARKEQRTNNK